MQNILYHEIWVNTAMIQTSLMCMLDISVTWTNPTFYSWERLLKTELLQRIVGAWLWQLSSFPPQRSAKLFGAAAVLWLGSHVDSRCVGAMHMSHCRCCVRRASARTALVDRRKMWQSPRSARSHCVQGNGTFTALLAEVGWGIKNAMWTTRPC